MNKLFNVKLGITCGMSKELGSLKRMFRQEEINIWAKDQIEAVKLFICRLVENGINEEDLIFISCNKVNA